MSVKNKKKFSAKAALRRMFFNINKKRKRKNAQTFRITQFRIGSLRHSKIHKIFDLCDRKKSQKDGLHNFREHQRLKGGEINEECQEKEEDGKK